MKSKAMRPSVLVGCLFGLFGFAGLAESMLLARKAERAMAVVVDAAFVSRGSQSDNYDVTVAFRTADGQQLRAVLKHTREAPIQPGSEVAILYQTDNPARVRLDGFARVWGIYSGITVFGLIMVCAGFFTSSR